MTAIPTEAAKAHAREVAQKLNKSGKKMSGCWRKHNDLFCDPLKEAAFFDQYHMLRDMQYSANEFHFLVAEK